MFSFPADTLTADHSKPIFIDERGDVLALMIIDLQAQHEKSEKRNANHTLAVLQAVVDLHDKFESSAALDSAKIRFQRALAEDPFAGFALASRQDDWVLGRRAIRLMKFKSDKAGNVDFWKKISNASPTWQVALASSMLLAKKNDTSDRHSGKKVIKGPSFLVEVNTNMSAIAEQFKPR